MTFQFLKISQENFNSVRKDATHQPYRTHSQPRMLRPSPIKTHEHGLLTGF